MGINNHLLDFSLCVTTAHDICSMIYIKSLFRRNVNPALCILEHNLEAKVCSFESYLFSFVSTDFAIYINIGKIGCGFLLKSSTLGLTLMVLLLIALFLRYVPSLSDGDSQRSLSTGIWTHLQGFMLNSFSTWSSISLMTLFFFVTSTITAYSWLLLLLLIKA